MIVAIPQYKNDIAPCFEAASFFMITVYDGLQKVASSIKECAGLTGINRVQMLRELEVDTLICNGIRKQYRCLLETAGIQVVANIECSAPQALNKFLAGRLTDSAPAVSAGEESEEGRLDELIKWSREYFEGRGFVVKCGTEVGPFPIDLIAELTCPICQRPVRVAVCCGAHMYRADREIREFHHVTGSDYHARIYIRRMTPGLADCCREYGIDVIDPTSGGLEIPLADYPAIPTLNQLILNRGSSGH